MVLFTLLLIAIALLAWYFFGRGSGKATVSEVAKKSVDTVDQAAKKSVAVVDGMAKKSVGEAEKITASLAHLSKDWLGHIRLGRGTERAAQYQEWAKDDSLAKKAQSIKLVEDIKKMQQWLANLPENELKEITEELNEFGLELNFDPSWLGDTNLEKGDPELRVALEEAVMLYSLAYWRASQVQLDIEALAMYEIWQDDPYKGRNLELSQKIFARMVDERLVETSPELLLAPEKERREHVVQNVKAFAIRDRKTFNVLLKKVIAGEPSTTTTTPAGAKSTPAKPPKPITPVPSEPSAPVVSAEPAVPAVEEEVMIEEENKPAQKRVSRRHISEEA